MTLPQDDVARIAKGLSPSCVSALALLRPERGQSPYTLKRLGQKGGFTTLEALKRRGLVVECGARLGRSFSPHTTYKYRLTPIGLAVKAYRQEHPDA